MSQMYRFVSPSYPSGSLMTIACDRSNISQAWWQNVGNDSTMWILTIPRTLALSQEGLLNPLTVAKRAHPVAVPDVRCFSSDSLMVSPATYQVPDARTIPVRFLTGASVFHQVSDIQPVFIRFLSCTMLLSMSLMVSLYNQVPQATVNPIEPTTTKKRSSRR